MVRPPMTMTRTAVRAAVPHRAIAPVAVAAPGLSRTLLHPGSQVLRAGSPGRPGSARWIPSGQPATASGLERSVTVMAAFSLNSGEYLLGSLVPVT
jgi:hypothetical protein